MRRGKWVLREQTEIVDNVDKSVQNSIFPKKGKKWVCKTYPQNWGQNVDNVDNKKVEHIFCATCLVYHKVGGLAEEKTFYLDRQGGSVLQQVPLFVRFVHNYCPKLLLSLPTLFSSCLVV